MQLSSLRSFLFLAAALAVPRASAQDLQAGDILVGADTQPGALYRIRGADVTVFSIDTPGPYAFQAPSEVIVDSEGRVVFQAFLGSMNCALGLFRTRTLGAPPERLAVFPNGCAVPPGYPVPFPGETFGRIKGLHLSRVSTLDLDASPPQFITEDAYVFYITDQAQASGRLIRFLPRTGTWEEVPMPAIRPNGVGPFMAYHSGITYLSGESATFSHYPLLRRTREPVRVVVGGDERTLFGFYREIITGQGQDFLVTDDISVPNYSFTPCPGHTSTLGSPSNGQQADDTGLYEGPVLFDEYGSNGWIVASAGYATKLKTQISEVLLDLDPNNESEYYFLDASGSVGDPSACHPILQFVPMFPNASGIYDGIANAIGGMVGVHGGVHGEVVRIQDGQQIAPFLLPKGIAGFPCAVASPPDKALLLRFETDVRPMLADPAHRRIGIDAMTGTAINDFGDDGSVIDPSPGLLAIMNPVAGIYLLDVHFVSTTPFTLDLYTANLEESEGQHIRKGGRSIPGRDARHVFAIAADGTLSWYGGWAAKR